MQNLQKRAHMHRTSPTTSYISTKYVIISYGCGTGTLTLREKHGL